MATKRYYSKVAGSRYVFQDGTDVTFAHGFADIEDKNYQQELDEILGKNPTIYVQEKLPEPLPKIEQNAKSEAEVMAADAALAGKNVRTAQEIGSIPAEAGRPTDVNQSTVDPALKAEVMSSQVTAAAKAAQEARERAISRNIGAAPSVSPVSGGKK